MPFSLSVPNFNAALPAPRAEAPQSNLGTAIGAGILEGSLKIAEEYTAVSQAKSQTAALADALESSDPQSAAQFRALSKTIQPNFLSKDSGAGSKITQGLLDDALTIIKNGSAARSRNSSLELGSELRQKEAAQDFAFDSTLQSQKANDNIQYQRTQLENAEKLRQLDKQAELETLKADKEARLEIAAFTDSLKSSQINSNDRTGLSEELRSAITEGRIRGEDAKRLLQADSRNATNGDILQIFSESTVYPPYGSQEQPSDGLIGPMTNEQRLESQLSEGGTSREEAARKLFGK